MKEVVINSCYGGFGLSLLAFKRWADIKGIDLTYYVQVFEADRPRMDKFSYSKVLPEEITDDSFRTFLAFDKDFGDSPSSKEVDFSNHIYDRNIPRDDEALVQVVKELGKKANGLCAELKIIKIPEDLDYFIDEYDGVETIRETYRSWD